MNLAFVLLCTHIHFCFIIKGHPAYLFRSTLTGTICLSGISVWQQEHEKDERLLL